MCVVGVLYRSVCCTGRCAVPVGVLYRSVCCTCRCAVPVGVFYRSVCCTGRCVVPVGVLYRSVCCTGQCAVPVGVLCLIFRKVNFSEQTAAFVVYVINWLVFIAVVESVYSAVQTDCLYKADCVWSLESLIPQNRQRPLVYTALTDWFL